jgi:hypothetical protein
MDKMHLILKPAKRARVEVGSILDFLLTKNMKYI